MNYTTANFVKRVLANLGVNSNIVLIANVQPGQVIGKHIKPTGFGLKVGNKIISRPDDKMVKGKDKKKRK